MPCQLCCYLFRDFSLYLFRINVLIGVGVINESFDLSVFSCFMMLCFVEFYYFCLVQDGEFRPRRYLRGRPRPPVDFSLRVSNIASDVRVRDLKNALAECKVKPVNIKWRGQNGFALLHFARLLSFTYLFFDNNNSTCEWYERLTYHIGFRTGGQGDDASNVDSILAALRDLKVAAAEGDGVNVEPMNAVTRIEVTDEITAV